jgi:hypothetical protein
MLMSDEKKAEPLIVIALAGKARSGKDTIARQLIANYGFHRLAFADGIRAAFGAASGPSWDAQKELEAGGKTSRWMMQVMGTECRQDIGCPNHWIEQVAILVRYFSHYHPEPRRRFVVTDMRYPNEAEVLSVYLNRWNSYIETWMVERPDGPTIAESSHSSETSLGGMEPHRWIRNTGTRADLAKLVEENIDMILPGEGGAR